MITVPEDSLSNDISRIYQAESRRVLATLIRLLGNFDLAEEAMQEAFIAALQKWPGEGIPKNPRAWLVSAGRFKIIDRLRREKRGRELAEEQAEQPAERYAFQPETNNVAIEDDQLRLIFYCCHPTLPLDSRIALALREVCGMSTAEIARAYLVQPDAMKKRISRSKAQLREDKVVYEIPGKDTLDSYLNTVLHVIYLIYNEGYAATGGEHHQRPELTQEAIFLAREIVRLLPEPEALGLLSLLLLHESRSNARVDGDGIPISLESQDRSLWDQDLIDEGIRVLHKSVLSGRMGYYSLQAAIVYVHVSAPSAEATNWALIVDYYQMLEKIQPSPFIALQKAIATGMLEGPETGLVLLDALADNKKMQNYHLLYAAKADLARRAGKNELAISNYKKALKFVSQHAEKRYIQRQLEKLKKNDK